MKFECGYCSGSFNEYGMCQGCGYDTSNAVPCTAALTQCYDCGDVCETSPNCPSCGGETQHGYHEKEGIGTVVLNDGQPHTLTSVWGTYNEAKKYADQHGGIVPFHYRTPSGKFVVLVPCT